MKVSGSVDQTMDEPVPRWRKIKKSNQKDTVLHKDCISNIKEKITKTKKLELLWYIILNIGKHEINMGERR